MRVTRGWSPEGKQLFINVGYYATRPEALLALADYNRNPWDVDSVSTTFSDLFEAWRLKHEKVMTYKILQSYDNSFRHSVSLHPMAFKDIRTPHLQAVIDSISAGAGTKKKIKTLFSQLYKYAAENDIQDKDYSRFVVMEKMTAKEKTPFSFEEIKALFKSAESDWHYEIVLMLLFSGMRVNELFDMKNETVHLDAGYVVGGSKTDAGKNRMIPISRHVLPLFKKWHNPENEFLMVNPNGNKLVYSTFRQWFAANVSGGHTIHETRHTFVSIANTAELNQAALKRIVGHASTNVTDAVYTHKTFEDLSAQMVKFDAFCDGFLG